ncbi:hypothetical protein [Methyloceanibacter sp.]|nr:hypothetical protein [Methyloceanibacter sp.]
MIKINVSVSRCLGTIGPAVRNPDGVTVDTPLDPNDTTQDGM